MLARCSTMPFPEAHAVGKFQVSYYMLRTVTVRITRTRHEHASVVNGAGSCRWHGETWVVGWTEGSPEELQCAAWASNCSYNSRHRQPSTDTRFEPTSDKKSRRIVLQKPTSPVQSSSPDVPIGTVSPLSSISSRPPTLTELTPYTKQFI